MRTLELLNSVMEFLNRVTHWTQEPGKPDLHDTKLMVREARVKEAEELIKHYETAPPAAPAPAVREPLTEEWIAQFFMQLPLPYEQAEKIVRHVEQAHGIGGGGNG